MKIVTYFCLTLVCSDAPFPFCMTYVYMASGPIDSSSTTTVCGKRDKYVECPESYPFLTGFCGTRERDCNATEAADQFYPCLELGIKCAKSITGGRRSSFSSSSSNASDLSYALVRPFSCDWVNFDANDTGVCDQETEVVNGVCVGATQKGCGGTPHFGSVRCCLVRISSCAPAPKWYPRGSGYACPAGSALTAACSVRCDPLGLFGLVHHNPGVFACGGPRTYTRNSALYTSNCETNPKCPAGSVLKSFSQCSSIEIGEGTIISCESIRYGVVDYDDCVELTGNANLWCPRGMLGVSLCAPNEPAPNHCGAFDTKLKCCAVRQYHNMGEECSAGIVQSAAGLPTPTPSAFSLPAFYGFDDGTAAASESLAISSLGKVSSVAYCNGRLYMAVENEGVVLLADLTSERGNISYGLAGQNGYDAPNIPPSTWNSSRVNLNKPSALSVLQCRTVGETLLLVDGGNHMVRTMQPPSSANGVNNTFRSYRVVGENSTVPRQLVNGTFAVSATLDTVNYAIFRVGTQEVFVSTTAAIVLVPFSSPSSAPPDTTLATYYVGDGTAGPLTTIAGRRHIFRTEARLYNPQQTVLLDDVILYIADYDNVSETGLIYTLDLDSGLIANSGELFLPNGTKPFGLALYERTTLFIGDWHSHCLLKVDLTTFSCAHFAGICGSAGYVDHAPLTLAQFNEPRHLAVGDHQLFIADYANERVRRITLTTDTCGAGFHPLSSGCGHCATGFSGWPRCRQHCSVGEDCNYKATTVSGSPATNCTCECEAKFQGTPNCTACEGGLDLRFDCNQCLPHHDGFPTCRTSTPTLTPAFTPTATRTVSVAPTSTKTSSVSQTITLSSTVETVSSSKTTTTTLSLLSESLTHTWIRTLTDQHSETMSFTTTGTDTASLSSDLTSTQALTPSDTAEETLTEAVSRSFSLQSLSETEPTLSLSTSRSLSPFTETHSPSVLLSTSRSSSWALEGSLMVTVANPSPLFPPSPSTSPAGTRSPFLVLRRPGLVLGLRRRWRWWDGGSEWLGRSLPYSFASWTDAVADLARIFQSEGMLPLSVGGAPLLLLPTGDKSSSGTAPAIDLSTQQRQEQQARLERYPVMVNASYRMLALQATIFHQPDESDRTVVVQAHFGAFDRQTLLAGECAVGATSSYQPLEDAFWFPYERFLSSLEPEAINGSDGRVPRTAKLLRPLPPRDDDATGRFLRIVFPHDASYPLYADEDGVQLGNTQAVPERLLYLNFSSQCFEGSRELSEPSMAIVRVVHLPPEPFSPASLQQGGTIVAFVSALATVNVPAALWAQFPLIFLVRLAEGRFEVLPWPYHILTFSIGEEEGLKGKLMGACVANTALVIVAFLVHLGAARLSAENGDRSFLQTGMARVRFPGYWLCGFAFFLFPSVSCAVALLVIGKLVGALFVVLWGLMLIGVLWLSIVPPGGFRARFVEEEGFPPGGGPRCTGGMLKRFFVPGGRWRDSDDGDGDDDAASLMLPLSSANDQYPRRDRSYVDFSADETAHLGRERDTNKKKGDRSSSDMRSDLFIRRFGPLFEAYRPIGRHAFVLELMASIVLCAVLDGLLMGWSEKYFGFQEQLSSHDDTDTDTDAQQGMMRRRLLVASANASVGLLFHCFVSFFRFPTRLTILESLVSLLIATLQAVAAVLCTVAYSLLEYHAANGSLSSDDIPTKCNLFRTIGSHCGASGSCLLALFLVCGFLQHCCPRCRRKTTHPTLTERNSSNKKESQDVELEEGFGGGAPLRSNDDSDTSDGLLPIELLERKRNKDTTEPGAYTTRDPNERPLLEKTPDIPNENRGDTGASSVLRQLTHHGTRNTESGNADNLLHLTSSFLSPVADRCTPNQSLVGRQNNTGMDADADGDGRIWQLLEQHFTLPSNGRQEEATSAGEYRYPS